MRRSVLGLIPCSVLLCACRAADEATPRPEEAVEPVAVAASAQEPAADWTGLADQVRAGGRPRSTPLTLQTVSSASTPTLNRTRPVRQSAPSLRGQVRSKRLSGLKLDSVQSLREALAPVQTATGLPIVVTREAEEAALEAGAVFDLDFTNPVSVQSVLDLLTEMAGDDVAWTIQHEVVMVTTADKARDELVLGRYEVRILTRRVTNFAGPKIGHVFISGDDTEGVFGGKEESEPAFDESTLVTLVEENVEPESWGTNGTSINLHNGILFVRHTPQVQQKVQRLLAQLGAY